MERLILAVYDRFRRSPAVGWGCFVALTALLAVSVVSLGYKEDISDFLPLEGDNHTAMAVYSDVSGANRIFAVVAPRDTAATVDPQQLADGVDAFAEAVAEADSLSFVADMITSIDIDKMMQVTDFVYANMPCFLTGEDYARIDSLLASPGYVRGRLAEARRQLMVPSGGLVAEGIARDPLGLFAPVAGRLRGAGLEIDFESYDGYILSPDSRRAIVIMESGFGASESDGNARLAAMLEAAADSAAVVCPDLDIHIIGGPVIAAGNASQIKSDSMLAVAIASLLIVALLIYVFRNVRNIVLIAVSAGWGWLFAVGCIAMFYDSVSIIVIGIASVILGIAVNYPLHLIDHLKGSDRPRAALREIISPLVVGNVTTVGAFLCLVPLDSPALHDLGLFSSLLLVGTIVFVLVFLPHCVRTRSEGGAQPRLIERLASVTPHTSRWVVGAVAVLTVVFAYYSRLTEFDSDMRNINYMTPQQRADMEYFQSLLPAPDGTENLYLVASDTTWEAALDRAASMRESVDAAERSGLGRRQSRAADFMVSEDEQVRRLERWRSFVDSHRAILTDSLAAAAAAEGFSPGAFAAFDAILAAEYAPEPFDHFRPFVATVFSGSLSEDAATGRKSVVETLSVPSDSMAEARAMLSKEGWLAFDVRSMNGSIAETLSADFNYIGLACGAIVFIFLWLSLGRIELAAVSFMPMAVSWIWILGIMGLLGLQFNIVNVILATFIFGQGDDYTIFMTEGLSYELAYRRRVLASYKNSIVVSALIMFVGIGTLLVARHPALKSLGEVTVVGMLSVVTMAYLFPPLVFGWLVRSRGVMRYRPVTLAKLWRSAVIAVIVGLKKAVDAVGGKSLHFHTARLALRLMPGVKCTFAPLDPAVTAVSLAAKATVLDRLCLEAVSPGVTICEGAQVVAISGSRRVLPEGTWIWNGGHVTVGREVAIDFDDALAAVRDRYLYKGRDIERAARRRVRELGQRRGEFTSLAAGPCVAVDDLTGHGEAAMLLALLRPDTEVLARVAIPDAEALLTASLEGFATNITVTDTIPADIPTIRIS